jgi:hypothetical protein
VLSPSVTKNRINLVIRSRILAVTYSILEFGCLEVVQIIIDGVAVSSEMGLSDDFLSRVLRTLHGQVLVKATPRRFRHSCKEGCFW